MGEVGEGGFGFDEARANDAAGGIVNGEGKDLKPLAGPPLVGRAVVLEQVSVALALPSPPGFGATGERFAEKSGHVSQHVVADVRDGAGKAEPTLQLVADEAEVGFFTRGQKPLHEASHLVWPRCLVIAAGDAGREVFCVFKPTGSQVVELGFADAETGGGILPGQGAVVEVFECPVDDLGGKAVEKLFLCIALFLVATQPPRQLWIGALPQTPEFSDKWQKAPGDIFLPEPRVHRGASCTWSILGLLSSRALSFAQAPRAIHRTARPTRQKMKIGDYSGFERKITVRF